MNELSIEEKCREMIMYGYCAVRQFPKSEKHVLAAELRLSMLNLQRLIITAIKRYHKKTTLTDIDIELSILKKQVRLSKDLRFIDLKKYKNWSTLLVELGKMIGGWLKHVKMQRKVGAL